MLPGTLARRHDRARNHRAPDQWPASRWQFRQCL